MNEDQAANTGGAPTERKRQVCYVLIGNDVPPKKKMALDQMFGDFHTARPQTTKNTRERAKEDILKYRARDSLGLSGDVLQWWKKQEDLPLLSALAKSDLYIPATGVPSERVFSTAGDIVTAQRSLLHPDHVDQQMFLKKSLKAIKREAPDGGLWDPKTPHTYVCGKHFITGSHVKEPLHPDFVPTIFPHRTVADPNQKLNRYKHGRKREQTSPLLKRKVAKTTAVNPDLPTILDEDHCPVDNDDADDVPDEMQMKAQFPRLTAIIDCFEIRTEYPQQPQS
ncbi:unnamed protein product [Leuciscus chuanchicus]